MAAIYQWQVFVPGQDLPEDLETDYLPGSGDAITVHGREWIVETVDLAGDNEEAGAGRVYVTTPNEPAA